VRRSDSKILSKKSMILLGEIPRQVSSKELAKNLEAGRDYGKALVVMTAMAMGATGLTSFMQISTWAAFNTV